MFKVAMKTEVRGDFQSFGGSTLPPEWRRTYRFGMTTYPVEGSKLFAFPDLGDAECFFAAFADEESFVILECEAADCAPAYYIGRRVSSDAGLRLFWAGDRGTDVRWSAPDGSVMCSSIKPLRIVKEVIEGECET